MIRERKQTLIDCSRVCASEA